MLASITNGRITTPFELSPKARHLVDQEQVSDVYSLAMVDYLGVSIVAPRDGNIGKALMENNYERFDLKYTRRVLRPGGRALDIGACNGIYSLIMAQAVGTSGKVIAIEPDPFNASLIRVNKALNNFTQLEIIESAVTDREGSVLLHRGDDNAGDNRLVSWDLARPAVEVLCSRLDVLVGSEKFDMFKMDIQGSELAAICTCGRLLEDTPVCLVEYWPWGIRRHDGRNPRILLDFLRQSNYEAAMFRRTANQFGRSVGVLSKLSWWGLQGMGESEDILMNLWCFKPGEVR